MKHSAIEALIRTQYILDNSVPVSVEFIAIVDDEYEFIVTDYTQHGSSDVSIRKTVIKIKSHIQINHLDG